MWVSVLLILAILSALTLYSKIQNKARENGSVGAFTPSTLAIYVAAFVYLCSIIGGSYYFGRKGFFCGQAAVSVLIEIVFFKFML